jgi:cytochrome P450
MAMTEMRVVLTTLLRQAAIAPARAGKPARERRQTLSFGPDGVRVLLREAA